MADPEEVTDIVESEPSEPDIAEDIAAENDMGLHPDLTGEQIQRVVDDANAQGPQAAPQGDNAAAEGAPRNTRKRRYKQNMTAEAWKHFKKGEVLDDGSYDAICKYCGEVYEMGNQRGTGAFSLVLDNASSNDACIKELLDGPLVRASNRRPAWDVPTRWNSTYLMLELALELKPAIDRFAKVDKNYKCKLDDVQWEAVGALMHSLFKEYSEAYATDLQSQSSSSRPRRQSKQASNSANVNDVRAGLKDFLRGKKTSEPIKSELEQYLCEPLDETGLDEEFEILTWWKLKVPKYPVLSQLARDILAVPASTVASEATFSTSGRTLSSVRNCLNDESMEALICAQDWLRARIVENGVQVGATLWENEVVSGDTICGTQE
ncbi:hypothetical protein LUZ61_005349 [Rhynchospora tenuis]|uniref:HAT C-terminal dimerisation domain-containing protein n=1 Tax=Rhynchospora tenuis TaxID=198213 RepID=A0AAD5ZPE3_9POAL|nr:hypothetical protein LUZ61_005349 [Rhynchospora tenuis]